MPFKPGQSGNPGGRSKSDVEITELSRKRSKEAIERLSFWMRSDNAKASVSAANAILDRAFGKPKQAIVGDDEADPIRVLQKIVLEGVKP